MLTDKQLKIVDDEIKRLNDKINELRYVGVGDLVVGRIESLKWVKENL